MIQCTYRQGAHSRSQDILRCRVGVSSAGGDAAGRGGLQRLITRL